MNDPARLPHLIRLLDDPDELTRASLCREFAAYGPDLPPLLDRLTPPPSAQERDVIRGLLRHYADDWLRANWHAWDEPDDDKRKLEAGLDMLSFWLGDLQRAPGELTRRLDGIARDFLAANPQPTAFALAEHLGFNLGLGGVTSEYHAAGNSDLVQVLDSRQGLPLSLVCLFMLVADRCNLAVEGCNAPGHFLAVARQHDDVFLVDAFHGWQFWKVSNLLESSSPVSAPILALIERGTSAAVILKRALANLKKVYELEEESSRVRLMEELRSVMPAE